MPPAMRHPFSEIHRRDKLLSLVGWANLILFALMLFGLALDTRTVMGISPWIKPIKFSLSIAIYLGTLAWLLAYLPGPAWGKGLIRWGASLAMIAEIVCIVTQAARGTTSHYNYSTFFDARVFDLMAVMILLNTMLAGFLFLLFMTQRVDLAPAYLWGIRLGTLIFVIGGLQGMAMIKQNAHTVGAPDGGPGLPFANFSTAAGDLRVAHMLGLHALQIVPLAGWTLSRSRRISGEGSRVAGVFVFAAIYAGIGVLLFLQAMAGRPLLEM